MSITINVAKEYTQTPGGRFRKEGKYSGEDFRETLLMPAFMKATEAKQELVVNLDGGYGYATSFLEEAFGGLARATNNREVLNIVIVSEEEPALVAAIKKYMSEALK